MAGSKLFKNKCYINAYLLYMYCSLINSCLCVFLFVCVALLDFWYRYHFQKFFVSWIVIFGAIVITCGS